MQKLIDEKDARIIELEAQLGDPLALWWQKMTAGSKANGTTNPKNTGLSVSAIRAQKRREESSDE